MSQRNILADGNEISQLHINRQMEDRQRRLGDIMRKNGLRLKTVGLQSGIPYNTLRTYFPSDQQELFPSIMPITALVRLFGVIPDEWLSVLTEPEGKCFANAEDDDGAIEELADIAKKVEAALSRAKKKAGVA